MIKPLIPPLQEWGAPSVLDMQEVFNAIQFMLGTGCPVAGDMQGNPPFVGAKFQTSDQRALVRRIASHGKNGGTLDYVAGWFIMAGDYVNGGDARTGFVETNLITAGEQVTQLWPVLFGRCKLEIAFAHRTFAWGSDARGKAHVHVAILGLGQRKVARADKRLFSYPDVNGEPEESRHAALSPHLLDAGALSDPHLVVQEESVPIDGMPRLIVGSKPIDGGNYVFDPTEREKFLEVGPSPAVRRVFRSPSRFRRSRWASSRRRCLRSSCRYRIPAGGRVSGGGGACGSSECRDRDARPAFDRLASGS